MTSPTDEITNLRAALEDIESWCQAFALGSDNAGARVVCQRIAKDVRCALKTPRASKVVEPDTLRLDWVLTNCSVGHVPPHGMKATSYPSTREHIDSLRTL